MTAFDKYIDTEAWIDALIDLGVSRTTFAAEDRIKEKLNLLGRHAKQFRDTSASGVNATGAAIAADPTDFATVITAAINAAAVEDDDRHGAVLDILEKAHDRVYAEYVREFKRRGAKLLDLLKPAYTSHSAAAKHAWEELPAGVRTIEQADQVGAVPQWQQLKEAHLGLSNIRVLIKAWIEAGILNVPKNVGPVELMYRDHEQARELMARYGALRFTGAAAAHAKPALINPAQLSDLHQAEVDEKKIDIVRYDQRQADERDFARSLGGVRPSRQLNNASALVPR